MTRFLISTAFLLGANAIGLLVAAIVLADMDMSFGSFLIAVLIFTGVNVLVRPLLMKMAIKNFQSLQGGTALIATLIALIATAILSSGFAIRGASTWLLATIIVWLVSVLAGVLLPMLVLKRGVEEVRDRRAS